jgi:type I restriction enzyme S subunit
LGSVNPSKHLDETFDLYSIPAFDAGAPAKVLGSEIGSAKQLVRASDVLLSRIVPHIRRAWVVGASSGARSIASNEWLVFRSDRVDPGYLRHVLISDAFHSAFMGTVSGVGGSLLRAKSSYVSEIEIPLPALAEQRRIAALLDRADAVRRKRAESRRLVDELLRSVFLEMFGDPVRNEKGWEVVTLETIADIVSGVTIGRRIDPAREILEVPYLRVANVQDGFISRSEVKTTCATRDEVDRYALRAGDILLTEGGDPDKLGRGAVWDGAIDPCIHQNHVFRVRVLGNDFSADYLNALLGSSYGKRYFFKAAKQTTGIASINRTQLGRFPALAAPREIQRRFTDIVSTIDCFAGRVLGAEQATGSFGTVLSAQSLTAG